VAKSRCKVCMWEWIGIQKVHGKISCKPVAHSRKHWLIFIFHMFAFLRYTSHLLSSNNTHYTGMKWSSLYKKKQIYEKAEFNGCCRRDMRGKNEGGINILCDSRSTAKGKATRAVSLSASVFPKRHNMRKAIQLNKQRLLSSSASPPPPTSPL